MSQPELFKTLRSIAALQEKIDATQAALALLRVEKGNMAEKAELNPAFYNATYRVGDYLFERDTEGRFSTRRNDEYILVPAINEGEDHE